MYFMDPTVSDTYRKIATRLKMLRPQIDLDKCIAFGPKPDLRLNGEKAPTLDQLKGLWRYVVARYGAYAVTWLICGEYNQNGGDQAGRVAKTLALGAFIKEQDPYKRAMTVHPWWHAGDKRQAWEQPWYDFIMLQGAHAGHGNVPPTAIYRDAWKHQPPRPVLEAECNYEGIYAGKANREHTPEDVRRVAYHAIQAGSFGYT